MSPQSISAQNDRRALTQKQICQCFNRVFGERYQVMLVGGGAEPDYQPRACGVPAKVIAREDFAASALHEAAHWCVAGSKRRALPDYGYVYVPPPRGDLGQLAFFAAEARVQAVEWYLSRRAGLPFRASADDPDFCLQTLEEFQRKLWETVVDWESPGAGNQGVKKAAPPRALELGRALEQAVAAYAPSGEPTLASTP